MSAIDGYIQQIQTAVYGEQVRSSIVNALLACYSDVTNPSLQTEAFEAALNAAYAGGILDIQTVTQMSAMTNEKIIYRYDGTEAGKNKGLYFYNGTAWVLIGSEVQEVSLASQMTDQKAIYKYIGVEPGYVTNSLYCYSGTAWVPIGSGVLEAATAAQMTNQGAIYKYTGNESGYITNALYYYNGTEWTQILSGEIDLSSINEKLDALYDGEVDNSTLTWVDGKSIFPDVPYTASAFSYTIIPVNCIAEQVFHITSYFGGGNVAAKDKTGTTLLYEHPSTSGVVTYDFTAPKDTAFLLITCKTDSKSSFKVIAEPPHNAVGKIISELPKLDPISPYTMTDFEQTTNKYIDGNSGVETNYASQYCAVTDYIEIPPSAKIKLEQYAANNSLYLVGYALYTENRGVIKCNRYNEQNEPLPNVLEIDVPQNAKYLRFTIVNVSGVTLNPVLTVYPYATIKRLGEEAASIFDNKFTDLYSSCIFVGDSVTAGTGATVSTRYIDVFKSLTNWETVDKVAYAGYTTKQWVDAYLATTDFTNYDVLVLELGLNGGLTGDLSTDVDPYESYTDFADTLLGNYCKIIAKAKSQNENIFIALVISHYWPRVKVYIDKVYEVAEKYNTGVINLLDANECLQDQRFHTTDFLHFTDLGYFAKAHAVYRLMNVEIAKTITTLP